jgi:Insect cuticle protein
VLQCNFYNLLKLLFKICLTFVALIASVCCDTPIEDIEAQVEQADFRVNEEGGYKTQYKTTNNIQAQEEGDGQKVVEGSYSYVDPDGKKHTG